MSRVLGEVLPSVLTCFKPDIVLYDAGVDTHMHDSLGKLNLTDKGLQRRELQVCSAPLLSIILGSVYNASNAELLFRRSSVSALCKYSCSQGMKLERLR